MHAEVDARHYFHIIEDFVDIFDAREEVVEPPPCFNVPNKNK